MKKVRNFVMIMAAAMLVASCMNAPKVDPQPSSITKTDVDSASYTIGVYVAKLVMSSDLGDLNLSQIVKGYKDAIGDTNDEKFDQAFINENMNSFTTKRTAAKSEANLAAGEAFLAEIDKEEGVVKTESGLRYKVINAGSELKAVSDDDVVAVFYEGKTIDGKVFDSTYDENGEVIGDPVSFPLNRVIPGWTEGMKYIGEGGEIMLYIPSELGYGAYGPMGPHQTLIFKVQLVTVTPAVAE